MSATPPRYRRDSRGLQALLNTPDMDRAMGVAADAGEAHFDAIAPERSGAYKASLRNIPVTALTPTPRRARRLEAQTPYAADVERRRGTLGKVADMLERPARR